MRMRGLARAWGVSCSAMAWRSRLSLPLRSASQRVAPRAVRPMVMTMATKRRAWSLVNASVIQMASRITAVAINISLCTLHPRLRRMQGAERDVDGHCADDADGIKRGETFQIV